MDYFEDEDRDYVDDMSDGEASYAFVEYW